MMSPDLDYLDAQILREILEERTKDDPVKTLQDVPSPHLLKDIDKACELITKAINEDKKIAIFGDYDVDGVVSATILYDFFNYINKEISMHFPNRFLDGYGLSSKTVEKLQTDLIITVDNGISSFKAVELAKSKGIEVVITDHHVCPQELPNADAIVNPKQPGCQYPEKDITGSTVAWLLVAALKEKMNLDLDMKRFLDIIAFSIFADSMPLLSLNRTLVKAGFASCKQSPRPCVITLRKKYKLAWSYSTVMFNINPALNSAGRMKDVEIAFDFLSAKNVRRATELLDELEILNTQRKAEQTAIFKKVLHNTNLEDPIICVWGENWHEGVLGIVASKLTEMTSKPSIVMNLSDGIAKGSGRSKENIDLLQVVSESSHLCERFGGHKHAIGIAIKEENLEEFKQSVIDQCYNLHCEYNSFAQVLGILSPNNITNELVKVIRANEPYGQGFAAPVFYAKDIQIKDVNFIGQSKIHLSMTIRSAIGFVRVLWFNYDKIIRPHDKISFTYTLTSNMYKGSKKPQLQIQKVLKIEKAHKKPRYNTHQYPY